MKDSNNKSLVRLFFILSGSVVSGFGYAQEIYFNPLALKIGTTSSYESTDLTVYEKSAFPPGTYHARIYLNGMDLGEKDIKFILIGDQLTPQFTKNSLRQMGVEVQAITELDRMSDEQTINNLSDLIPDAKTNYDFFNQKLDISIPQLYVRHALAGETPRSEWDPGISALFTSYYLSGNQAWYKASGQMSSVYLNLNNGINLGSWRLRNNLAYSEGSGSGGRWSGITTYLQREIPALDAQVMAGRISTSSTLFDSFFMDGIQIGSDDNMLPYSQQGFAPVITGIANSQSQITVKQNGYTIYQTYVPAGAFSLRDIASVGNGDLDVTIREADGREHTFVQPYTSVPGLLRPGRVRFSGAVGQYVSTGSGVREPVFGTAQLQYGLSNALTTYGGSQVANNYTSAMGGVALGASTLGAVSFDVTHANSQLTDDSRHSGQSLRMQYAKGILDTGTNVVLAGYRYSTSGYYDFSEANSLRASNGNSDALSITNNKKSRIQLQINQSMGELGSLSFTAYQQNYWRTSQTERNLSLSHYLSLAGIGINTSISDSRVNSGASNRSLAVNISLPFSRFLPSSWASYGLTTTQDQTTNSASLFGQLNNDPTWNYSLRSFYGSNNQGLGGNVDLRHTGKYGTYNSGYAYNSRYQQVNFAANGGIVLHESGITFGQPLGNTFALVSAPQASNVKVANGIGVETDWRGYTIVPYVSSYHRNKIALDSTMLPDGVDFDNLTPTVVPTEGAIVQADFKGYQGYQLFIKLRRAGNTEMPFGAVATLNNNEAFTGIVDEKGTVYLKGLPDNGIIYVKWGDAQAQQCQANYAVANKKTLLQQLTVNCL